MENHLLDDFRRISIADKDITSNKSGRRRRIKRINLRRIRKNQDKLINHKWQSEWDPSTWEIIKKSSSHEMGTQEITPKTIDYDWREHKNRRKASKNRKGKRRQDRKLKEKKHNHKISSQEIKKEITSLNNEINKANQRKLQKTTIKVRKRMAHTNLTGIHMPFLTYRRSLNYLDLRLHHLHYKTYWIHINSSMWASAVEKEMKTEEENPIMNYEHKKTEKAHNKIIKWWSSTNDGK